MKDVGCILVKRLGRKYSGKGKMVKEREREREAASGHSIPQKKGQRGCG